MSISPGPTLAMPGLRSYGRLLNDLDTILRVRATVYLLVVCDLREVVEDTVLVLWVRDRREVGHGVAVVALAAGEHVSPQLAAVARAVLHCAKLLP